MATVLDGEGTQRGAVANAPAGSRAAAWLRLCRPRQWTKNALVLAAPAAAGTLTEPEVLGQTVVALVAFCLAASATYMLNDARDVAADRRHPVKRRRPVAAGLVSVTAAERAAVAMAIAAVGLSALARPELMAVVGGYLALTAVYSVRLKHEPVLDITAVASGFFLRAVAGGVASTTPLSSWFVIVTAFGSLYVVAGKRFAEVLQFGTGRGEVRRSLDGYTAGYLTHVIAVAAGVAIVGYCLWSFEGGADGTPSLAAKLSIVPFVVGMLRYGLIIDRGLAAEPEEILLRDRELQLTALVWAILLAIDVYLS